MQNPVNRNAAKPLYRQAADGLRQDIRAGRYAPGSRLPTEAGLCSQFGISRFPLRQALNILAKDGLIERIPGRGTFVSQKITDREADDRPDGSVDLVQQPARFHDSSPIALMLPDLYVDYTRDITRGFIQAAAISGRAALIATSGDAGEEERVIDRLLAAGAAGLVVFPCSEQIAGRLIQLRQTGVACALIDRHMGLADFDFIETDNVGGGFMAARHMAHHGYPSVLFVGDSLQVSSVQERLLGFRQGVAQYGLRWLNTAGAGVVERRVQESVDDLDFSLASCLEHFDCFDTHRPLAIFCENDSCALRLTDRLLERGLSVGNAIGIIGFDNESAGRYHQPPLTTIAQNGWLIGETAARVMTGALTGTRQAIVRHVLPTQIIVRRSCGEEPGLPPTFG